MRTNYETVIKEFLPAFRQKTARIMVNEYGIRQQQAAIFLGTTQAAISKYLSSSASKYSNIKIEQKSLRQFVLSIKSGDDKGAQKVMCAMCQANRKFDCAFMVNK